MSTKAALYGIPNLRMIRVRYVGPTNARGSRLIIEEPKRGINDKTQRKTYSYDYATGDIAAQAYGILIENGWNIVARCSDADAYYFLCDNWSEDYKEVAQLK